MLEVTAGAGGLERVIRGSRIQKSGLALVGHFHGIEPSRIQILGVTEQLFLRKLSRAKRGPALSSFFELGPCCVVVTECQGAPRCGRAALDDLVAHAQRSDTPLLLSPERSSRTIMALHDLLDDRLAPRVRMHGVLVDVFQVGLLLLGPSGVGKSEVALELVMRGHRLVADDVVECHYRPPGMVFGAPADLLRHHLEVRGLGILNIKDLFGVTAIRERKRVDVVVRLVAARSAPEPDRLGLDRRHYEVLGVSIPEVLIIVRPGRDMASIMEIAARNELLRRAGRHPGLDVLGSLDIGDLEADSFEEPSLPTVARADARAERGESQAEDADRSGAAPRTPSPESLADLPFSKKE